MSGFKLANDKRDNNITCQNILSNSVYATDIFGTLKGNSSGLIFNSSNIIFNSRQDFCVNASDEIKLNASRIVLNGSLVINNNQYGYFLGSQFAVMGNNNQKCVINANTIQSNTTRTLSCPNSDGTILLNQSARVDDSALLIGQGSKRFRFDTFQIGLNTTRTINIRNQSGTMALTSDLDNLGAYSDSVFRIFNNASPTRQFVFNASAIAFGTTRTYTMPNESGRLAVVETGTYTPTVVLNSFNKILNISVGVAQYQRIGNFVYVYGNLIFDTIATPGVLALGLSLPPFNDPFGIIGVCAFQNQNGGSIGGTVSRNTISLQPYVRLDFVSSVTSSLAPTTGYFASYSYLYLPS